VNLLTDSGEYDVRIRRWKAALANQEDWVAGRSRMTAAELAWVAGLIEGEGCFFVTERKTERYGPYRYARVTVCMTDHDTLALLRAVTGVGTIERPRERKNPRHKPISQWIVCRNEEAVQLMLAIYPLMGMRRQAKIREVLAQVEKEPA